MKRIAYLFFCGLLSWTSINAQETPALNAEGLFGDLSARHIGPALMSGRITDLEGHPTNSRILYAGAAGGGVWRSNDGGITFNSIFDDYPQSIGAIEVDPTDPDLSIWVGTGETWTRNSVSVGKGLFKTTDGGQTWKLMGLENSERISSILVNPNNPKEVFVGVLGALWGDSEDRGVYKTADGGQSWEKILYTNATTGCADLVMAPDDPQTLYASMWEFRRTAWSFSSGGQSSALYKSTDGGATWAKIHNGFPEGKLGRIAVAVAPSNPSRLYAVIESEKNEDKGLYRSDDAGQSWEHLNKDFELTVRPFYFSRIVVSPANADKIAKAGLNGSISEDGGNTFRAIGSGVHADVHDFWFDPNDADRMYLGCDGGVYRSWDGGRGWEMVKGLPVSQYYHVAVDMQEPFRIYGGLQDNGSWVGPSQSVGGIEARDWTEVGYGDGFRVYPHPTDPNICYSEMQGAEAIWRVDLEKQQSKIIKPYPEKGSPDLRFNWNTPITTSAHQPDRLYVGSQFVHRSDDRGETWKRISPDLTTNDPAKQNQEDSGGLSKDNSGAENHCTIFTIAESPLNEKLIFVGTDDGNVQRTKDGGQSWVDLTGNFPGLPKNTWAYHIEPSHFDENVVYAVFEGHTQNDHTPYVYRSKDGGLTWSSITTPQLEGFARCLQEDLANPNLLYLGTELGLYITLDGGQNWAKFTNNMPAVAVHHLALHPRDHSLVMATHGRGIIIIDDVTPLRKLTPEIAAQDVVFMEQPPAVIYEAPSFGGNAAYGEFVGDNPSRSAKVVYYLKKRHIFGPMKLEVLDSKGEKIAELTPGKSKGINIVPWNYRYRMPKVAKAKTFSRGGFAAPTVPPGVYTLRMAKGKTTYESTLELIADPASVHTAEERKAQHETAMQLYAMNEELAYLVDQVDQVSAGVSQRLEAEAPKKLKQELMGYQEALEKLREGLVVTTGDNYVGAAAPKLRERMGSLYSEVVGYAGRPSNAQMDNLSLLQGELQQATEEGGRLIGQLQALNKKLSANGLEALSFRSKEEFMEADQ